MFNIPIAIKVSGWLFMVSEELLKYIWGNVNDWLKWAETKTAALFAVDATIIVAIMSSL